MLKEQEFFCCLKPYHTTLGIIFARNWRLKQLQKIDGHFNSISGHCYRQFLVVFEMILLVVLFPIAVVIAVVVVIFDAVTAAVLLAFQKKCILYLYSRHNCHSHSIELRYESIGNTWSVISPLNIEPLNIDSKLEILTTI